MKASSRTLNSVIAKCGQFYIARPDLTKSIFVVLCGGEEMERFNSFKAACDACDGRK